MRGLVLSLVVLVSVASALENGLARTPPMGWLAWERFRCNVDCHNDPENCISEYLFKSHADSMVNDGYLEAGYDTIIMDDCWPATKRNAEGKLYADPDRFPSGIMGLSDYVHSLGLKFGIYEDYGTHTCAGYPGVLGHEETDAQSFADWKVDYLKLDGCYCDPKDMDEGYPAFGKILNATGRPMVYSCSWPAYQSDPNYAAMVPACNLWRNWDDIQDSWESVITIIDWFVERQDHLATFHGPGHWNDPDMLIIGNFGLSYDQSKAQMAIWAAMGAPLIMSTDLRIIEPRMRDIYLNKAIIAVNQDELGLPGKVVYNKDDFQVWTKPILPQDGNGFSYGVTVFNRRTDGTASTVIATLRDIGLDYAAGYKVTDLYSGADMGIVTPDQEISIAVNPTGVMMYRCDINKAGMRYRPASYKLNQGFDSAGVKVKGHSLEYNAEEIHAKSNH